MTSHILTTHTTLTEVNLLSAGASGARALHEAQVEDVPGVTLFVDVHVVAVTDGKFLQHILHRTGATENEMTTPVMTEISES